MFIKIAFLNMFKHWKRTMLILFAIAVSVIVMEFVSGMILGMKQEFFKNTESLTGHIQIHAKGWNDRLNPYSIDLPLNNPESIITVLQGRDGFQRAEKILSFGTMVIRDDKNLTLLGNGVEKGTQFFSKITDNIQEGRNLQSEEDILISQRLAELLNVQLGDYLTLLVEDSESSPYYLDFTICGLFDSGFKSEDENNVYILHQSAEELLYLPGKSMEIRVQLDNRDLATAFVESLNSENLLSEYEVETWRDINGSMVVLFEVFDFFMVVINFFVVFVAAIVITNAILMNVFERVREFGTIRAIGLKKRQLFGMILTEGAVQGLVGSLIGLAVGIPIVLYLQTYGFDIGEVMEEFNLVSTVTFSYSVLNSLINLIFGMSIAVAGSLYASIVASKLDIIDSLSYV